MERLCIFIHIYNKPYISLWPIRSQFDMDLARAPRRARLTARKKGSGYENEGHCEGRPSVGLGTRMKNPKKNPKVSFLKIKSQKYPNRFKKSQDLGIKSQGWQRCNSVVTTYPSNPARVMRDLGSLGTSLQGKRIADSGLHVTLLFQYFTCGRKI